jgi:predicted transposase/invertase (TIGR01784 family)
MTEFDQGYRLLFSHPEMVEDLLKGFVREDWVAALDFGSLEKLDTHHISDTLKERISDVIWRVRFKDQWLYVCILLEFQSTTDEYMALRCLVYVGLFYQDILRTKKIAPGDKLPPVLPIVLYNGEPRWNAATDMFDLIERMPGNLAKYSPRMKYLLMDEGAYEGCELESIQNFVSVLFQLEKTPAEHVGRELLVCLVRLLEERPRLQRPFAAFISQIYFKSKVDVERLYREAKSSEEVTDMLSKNVDRWIEEWKAEGKAEGEAQGETRGRIEALRLAAEKMLAKGMPIAEISEITGLAEEEIQTLRESLAH